ncbi:ankyrin repeat-containing domain protein [Xylariaceae sp. FL0594]|nr:ankyrin repeat-containing domain protein [Xylariaceae sp. FL0594]
MDPLSISASIVAVGGLAKSVASAISNLRSLCKSLPGRLHAVHNEIADLELVLLEVASLTKTRTYVLGSDDSAIPHLLRQARSKLSEILDIVRRLTVAYNSSRSPLVGVSAWRREQKQLQILQEDIRTVKCSLNILLGASNSQDMMRIRLDVQAISTTTLQSSQNQLALAEKFMTTLNSVDDRIARVEDMLKDQSQQLQRNQFMQVGSLYADDSLSGPPPPQLGNSTVATHHETDLSVRVIPRTMTCRPSCTCTCHRSRRTASPSVMNRIFGQLFVGYAGLPVFSPKCDDEICQRSRMQFSYGQGLGPAMHLETLRRVPDSAQSVTFAFEGNLEGLKHLFKHGLASPRDISTSRGYSLLRWALYGQQYETCTFLVRAGADPNYRPIAASDNSPRVKACHFLLEGGLEGGAVEALRVITRGSEYLDDYIDGSRFTRTHRIVLGLLMVDLEKQIVHHPGEMNVQDAMGRTPLAWAAARGDSRSVVTLLKYGADPNIMDIQLSGPVSNAAAHGHTTVVQVLLDAGADAEPALPEGIRKGSPLNVAARNGRDPLLIKRLLDFGADVNQCSTDGKTALFHAAKNNDASLAILLLEYGAEINHLATTGETPLTIAITHNSHGIIRLFLERWHEYSVCPRLKGPHLLDIAALYAGHETLGILAATDHFRLRHDEQYTLGDFRAKLQSRPDVTEKIVIAFDELLSVINEAPSLEKEEDDDDVPNSAFFSCLPSRSSTFDQDPAQSDSGGGDGPPWSGFVV